MKLNFGKIFPKDPSTFNGLRFIRVVTAFFLLVALVRSCIHLFVSDGGANSIAGINISVEGGNNIIAIFSPVGSNTANSCRTSFNTVFPLSRINPIDCANPCN